MRNVPSRRNRLTRFQRHISFIVHRTHPQNSLRKTTADVQCIGESDLHRDIARPGAAFISWDGFLDARETSHTYLARCVGFHSVHNIVDISNPDIFVSFRNITNSRSAHSPCPGNYCMDAEETEILYRSFRSRSTCVVFSMENNSGSAGFADLMTGLPTVWISTLSATSSRSIALFFSPSIPQ